MTSADGQCNGYLCRARGSPGGTHQQGGLACGVTNAECYPQRPGGPRAAHTSTRIQHKIPHLSAPPGIDTLPLTFTHCLTQQTRQRTRRFIWFMAKQEFDLAHREQAPERQMTALCYLESQPGENAANLLRAAAICDGAPLGNKRSI